MDCIFSIHKYTFQLEYVYYCYHPQQYKFAMAFWALGKVKNITSSIKNVKEVGQKLKNYYAKPNEDKFIDIDEKKIERLSEEELMQRQLKAYKKLKALEERIIAQISAKQRKELQQKQDLLKKIQEQFDQQNQEIVIKQQMGKLISQVESGNKDLKQIMKQNILMREQIYKRRIEDNGQKRRESFGL